MVTRDIRAFVSRDGRAARESKDAYWSERLERLGPAEGLRIAEELRRQALLMDPEWPRPDDLRQGILSHVRLTALLRRGLPARRP